MASAHVGHTVACCEILCPQIKIQYIFIRLTHFLSFWDFIESTVSPLKTITDFHEVFYSYLPVIDPNNKVRIVNDSGILCKLLIGNNMLLEFLCIK